jgi:hypothetical protein
VPNKRRDLSVPEIHQLIVTHATQASALAYQEAVGRAVARQAATHVRLHARAYSRTAVPANITLDDVTAALADVAGILQDSTFPDRLIDLCGVRRDDH